MPTMTRRLPTVHEAGPFVNGVQQCVRCGYVLTDYRHVFVTDGAPPPRGWVEGAFIEVSNGAPRWSSTTDDEPTCPR